MKNSFINDPLHIIPDSIDSGSINSSAPQVFKLTIAIILVGLFSTPNLQAKQCAAAKLGASGVFAYDSLSCYSKGVEKGKPVSAACLHEAKEKLYSIFTKEDNKGKCEIIGDVGIVNDSLDSGIADLVANLGGPGPSKCTTYKFKAAGEEAKNKFACQADAARKGAGYGLDPACWARAEKKFSDDFTRAETKGDCIARSNDVKVIGDKINAWVLKSKVLVLSPIATCSPVEVTTVHGEGFLGNSRLAKIENSTVPCLHVEEATRATCAFSTAIGHESGEWLESPQGNFAKTGQSISLNGTQGGDYVIAAKVSDAAPAPCIEPTSMDTAGRIAEGSELPKTCVVEDINHSYNALSAVYGFKGIDNYVDTEVCSSNNPAIRPHPDDALIVRSYAQPGSLVDDTFCYTGYGAALNDINGTERDDTLTYYPDEEHCHLISSNGVQVPGAKRPATKSLPAPGSVNTNSFILWRPVSSNINIASSLQVFDNLEKFRAATGAFEATGELPDLGIVSTADIPGSSRTVKTVTFREGGGSQLVIGTDGGVLGPLDWYEPLPGNDIKLSKEDMWLDFAEPVKGMGIVVVEPNVTMPEWGGTPVNSKYAVQLYNGLTPVGSFYFDAPDDVISFIGVYSNNSHFTRARIVDTTGNIDDEYFGPVFTAY